MHFSLYRSNKLASRLSEELIRFLLQRRDDFNFYGCQEAKRSVGPRHAVKQIEVFGLEMNE